MRIRPSPPVSDTPGIEEAERTVAALMANDARERTRRYDSMRASWKRKPYNKDSAYRKTWQRDSAWKITWEKKPPPVIQINASDSADWERLPHIGPGYAGRIVRFRSASAASKVSYK